MFLSSRDVKAGSLLKHNENLLEGCNTPGPHYTFDQLISQTFPVVCDYKDSIELSVTTNIYIQIYTDIVITLLFYKLLTIPGLRSPIFKIPNISRILSVITNIYIQIYTDIEIFISYQAYFTNFYDYSRPKYRLPIFKIPDISSFSMITWKLFFFFCIF